MKIIQLTWLQIQILKEHLKNNESLPSMQFLQKNAESVPDYSSPKVAVRDCQNLQVHG